MTSHAPNVTRIDAPRSTAGRLPPNDLDAEAAVLSACMLSSAAIDEIVAILAPEDFYSDANGRVFAAILELHGEGQPADVVTVAAHLRARDQLQRTGGAAYIGQLADSTPAVAHVASHARIVRTRARERNMIATLQRHAAEGYGEHAADWLETVARDVEEVATEESSRPGDWMGGAVRSAFESMQASVSRGGLLGWSTGLRDLDRRTGGLLPGGVTVIGGRPGMGKTALAFKIAESVCEQSPDGERLGACVFSLEMPLEDLARRQTFTRARVDGSPMKRGQDIGAEAWGKLNTAAVALSKLPLFIDDTSGLSPMMLRARARQARADMAKRYGAKLAIVVVDYLQLMNGRAGLPRGASREQEVAECSKRLKELAKELGVHVIALSQLNRSVEGRTVKDRRPRMADLRESGSVEQDADNIILLYREEQYEPETDRKGIAELLIEKQRAGAVGVSLARFTAWCTRFDDLEGDTSDDLDEDAAGARRESRHGYD